MNLHFYSPKAYYVRETFGSCLPHPKTLSSWYKIYNCNPGFSQEAFMVLKLTAEEAAKIDQKLICNLVLMMKSTLENTATGTESKRMALW